MIHYFTVDEARELMHFELRGKQLECRIWQRPDYIELGIRGGIENFMYTRLVVERTIKKFLSKNPDYEIYYPIDVHGEIVTHALIYFKERNKLNIPQELRNRYEDVQIIQSTGGLVRLSCIKSENADFISYYTAEEALYKVYDELVALNPTFDVLSLSKNLDIRQWPELQIVFREINIELQGSFTFGLSSI